MSDSQSEQRRNLQPILLGSDINVYGMARSFYEAYDVKSIAYASAALAPTRDSQIVTVQVTKNFDSDPVFIEKMRKVAAQLKDDTNYLLIPCGDGYAELVAKHRDELTQSFLCPGVDHELFTRLEDKVQFYEMCDKYGLPYPDTLIIRKEMVVGQDSISLPFDFPVALKPANSVEWLSIDFEGKKKAFTIHTTEELNKVLHQIYEETDYSDVMICQDFIPGDDSHMRVLNAYVDQNHNVRMMCLGHPLLEDPSPSAIGNYVVIMPDYDDKIYQRIQHFLEAIEYSGFANFDMKYDPRDDEYKLFEINLRQGRSSFYCTLNGYNLAEYVTEDLVMEQPFIETTYGQGDMLWMGVPKKVFKEYAKPGKDKDKAMAMLKSGHWGTTVFYDKDKNLKRTLLMKYAFHRYIGQYKKYFKENKG